MTSALAQGDDSKWMSTDMIKSQIRMQREFGIHSMLMEELEIVKQKIQNLKDNNQPMDMKLMAEEKRLQDRLYMNGTVASIVGECHGIISTQIQYNTPSSVLVPVSFTTSMKHSSISLTVKTTQITINFWDDYQLGTLEQMVNASDDEWLARQYQYACKVLDECRERLKIISKLIGE